MREKLRLVVINENECFSYNKTRKNGIQLEDAKKNDADFHQHHLK